MAKFIKLEEDRINIDNIVAYSYTSDMLRIYCKNSKDREDEYVYFKNDYINLDEVVEFLDNSLIVTIPKLLYSEEYK